MDLIVDHKLHSNDKVEGLLDIIMLIFCWNTLFLSITTKSNSASLTIF